MQGSRSIVPYMFAAWVAAAWIGGVAASATFGAGAWPLAIALGAALAAYAAWRHRRLTALYALLLPAVFVTGAALERTSRPELAEDAVAHYNDGVAMRVRGVVRDDAVRGDTSQRFAVDVTSVQRAGAWVDASGGVLVTRPLLPQQHAGDIVELEGQLESPPRIEDFDYAQYLALRNINSVMVYPAIATIGHEEQGALRQALADTRSALKRGIGLALPEPHAALAQGVLLGERSALPDDVVSDLNSTNTSHLVVVSGSNVVLVAGFSTLILAWFVRRRQAQALSIVVVIAYAALVGLSPPVARATIMGVVLVLAGMSGRRGSGLTSILIAAALMTAWNPNVVRDVSFQLSFAATAGIITLASPLRRSIVAAAGWITGRAELPRWFGAFVAEPAGVTIAAIVATAPLIALSFGRVSLVALPANMLIVPAFPFILAASLVAAIGGLLPAGHVLFGAPAYWLLTYWLEVAAWFAALPAATLRTGWFGTPAAVVTYAVVIAMTPLAVRLLRNMDAARLAESHPFRWRTAVRRTAVLLPALLLLVSIGWIASGGDDARRLEVTVLDVGQGDAILIETPAGQRVLIDGGPGPAVLRGLGDELPWHERGIDVAVLTHAQSDHGTGIIDVFERYEVDRLLTARDALAGNASTVSALHQALYDALLNEQAQHIEVEAGTMIDLGSGTKLEVLWPPPGLPEDASSNNTGVVLLLRYGEISFLLAADIEGSVEEELARRQDLEATVLKVAHHGSKTSSTSAFVDAVQPQIAVVSSGEGNRFGHPAPEAIARLDDYAVIYNTATDGDVHFETDGERLWIATAR